jgi:hypothetical protein
MMKDGSGSGSITLTSGSRSGSRRPKNMWIRIRNTAGIKLFLVILHDERWVRIRIHTSDYWIRIQEAPKPTDPMERWKTCLDNGEDAPAPLLPGPAVNSPGPPLFLRSHSTAYPPLEKKEKNFIYAVLKNSNETSARG